MVLASFEGCRRLRLARYRTYLCRNFEADNDELPESDLNFLGSHGNRSSEGEYVQPRRQLASSAAAVVTSNFARLKSELWSYVIFNLAATVTQSDDPIFVTGPRKVVSSLQLLRVLRGAIESSHRGQRYHHATRGEDWGYEGRSTRKIPRMLRSCWLIRECKAWISLGRANSFTDFW